MLTKPKPEQRIPGPARGDLVLERDALPETIGEWRCTQFQPALAPEKLPEGQYWWTHSWNYSNTPLVSIVSFDQAGFADWHELTVCYRAIDWQMKDRRIIPAVSGTAGSWNVVLAEFERQSGDRALLAFSLFNQDGQPIESPDSDFKNTEGTILDRFQGRVNPRQFHISALQTQVFVQHHSVLSEESVQEIIELHLQTRDRFREVWLEQSRMPKSEDLK
jgi:hypothetical protein